VLIEKARVNGLILLSWVGSKTGNSVAIALQSPAAAIVAPISARRRSSRAREELLEIEGGASGKLLDRWSGNGVRHSYRA
jgi:hypothetical protein